MINEIPKYTNISSQGREMKDNRKIDQNRRTRREINKKRNGKNKIRKRRMGRNSPFRFCQGLRGTYDIIGIQRSNRNRTINIIPPLFPQIMKRIHHPRNLIRGKDHEPAEDVTLVRMQFNYEFIDYAEVGAASYKLISAGTNPMK